MDTYLNILGIALSIGALITIRREYRKKVVLTTAIVLLLGISALSLFENWTESRRVERIKSEVVQKLTEKPKPWDHVFKELFYRSFEDANRAFDELQDQGRISDKWVSVTTDSGDRYDIRVYSLSPK